jgi:Ca2+-binding RTX toxin-like protein
MRFLVTLAAALTLSCVAAADALAFVVVSSTDGQTLFYRADPGESNRLTVSLAAGTYTFSDPGGFAGTTAAPCTRVDDNTVTCQDIGFDEVQIRLHDLDDSADFLPDTPSLLVGEEGDDVLTAGGGNDQLDGEEGNDTIRGGAGNDELNAESIGTFLDEVPGLRNTLDGGAGDDTIGGGGGQDTVEGGSGNDTIRGWAGVDTLDGGDDTDAVTGGAGNDVMRGGAGDDQLGDSSLLIQGVPPDCGDDQIDGGTGNDLLRPGAGPTTCDVDAGSPVVSDNDTLNGGVGADQVLFERRVAPVSVFIDDNANDGGAGEADNVATDIERLVGGEAGDTLVGSPAGETIDGFRGADMVRGGGGADVVDGGAEDAESDDVSGGDGDDQVRGNAGDDALAGDAGDDTVEGGGGADEASGGTGADNMTGGPGIDVVGGGDGDDTLDGSSIGPVGDDGADTVNGGDGDDSIEGGDGDDTMAGGPGVDRMSGELGRDTVEYASARSEVEVTLNDRADDGEQGEGDNVRSDVENVTGGGVQDTFTGSRDANTLDGGTGEDYVDGRRGRDELLGGSSVDVVRARDGRRDVIDCGQSTDFAIVDRVDRVRRCERRAVGRGKPSVGRAVVVSPTDRGVEFGPPESSRTVPLLDRIQVPVASFVDSTDGQVRLTAAAGRRVRQSALLRGARFSIAQRRARRPITDINLKGGNFRQCRRAAPRGGAGAAQVSRRTVRRLRARLRGRFRANGNHSSATARGTIFTVADRCDGTLTRVQRGVVVVRDFRRQRTIVLRAGRSYLARAPVRASP